MRSVKGSVNGASWGKRGRPETRSRRWRIAAAGGAVAALGLLASPAPASACGGFFCDTQPVDQSSEDILFHVDPASGRVRAVITIQYEGDAENFSWILPVNSVPEVSFSTDLVFRQIRSQTDVTFSAPIERRNCRDDEQRSFGGAGAAGTADAMSAEGGEGGEAGAVAVLASGQTGPYDYVVLQSADTEALIEWLTDNDYVVPPTSAPLMDHYTAQGMPFVAVKLQKSASTGDILPIVLDMEEPEPCVPIVLTQVAAQPDMPIRIWVAGPGRALPRNWFHVEPNWVRLNWGSPAFPGQVQGVVAYDELVSRAVDEGAGRGFVTEFAGSGADSATSLGSLASTLDTLATRNSASQIIDELGWRLGVFTPAIITLLSEVLPMPADLVEQGVTPEQFYTQSWQFWSDYQAIEFDKALVAERFREQLTDPLRDAQGWLAGSAWLTRMYTRISPEEMTRDPFFVFSDQWPEVDRARTATQVWDCEGTSEVRSFYIEVDGGPTYLTPAENPEVWAQLEPTLPWASQVALDIPGQGAFPVRPTDVPFADDQLAMLSAALVTADLEPAEPWSVPSALQPTRFSPSGSSKSGCRHAAAQVPLAAFAALALFVALRRRRD